MNRAAFLDKLLGYLEKKEEKLLSWGFYNSWLSYDEIESAIESECPPEVVEEWKKLKKEHASTEDLLNSLAAQGLLYTTKFNRNRGEYRTRFAESVRLIAALKQMFKEKDWQSGPSLVSDIKLHLAARKYPIRDKDSAACWNVIKEHCHFPKLQKEVFEGLSKGLSGKEIEFSGFQLRSFERILKHYIKKDFSGTVICAGTGAGKTKAFYVPAYLGICSDLSRDKSEFVKIIAVYPRNVLLADQLREAISEAQKIKPVLEKFGIRPIRFGALLGAAPESSWFRAREGKTYAEQRGWLKSAEGYVVPYLKSPKDPRINLVWRNEDRRQKRSALFQENSEASEPDVCEDELVIAREDIAKRPPDVLFLSAEMLNRELGNPAWKKAFGIGQRDRSPRLLLLDEAHSYEGINGAQIAWLLRRWQYFAKMRSLHAVGLSATLDDATQHMARLVNIPQKNVDEICPSEKELESEGMEYSLAVKGDPVSGTTLLATTIQLAMLLRRLLAPRQSALDAGAARFYGKKIFGFTDNLDSVNRWFSDMLDAEENKRLAMLRRSPERQAPRPIPMPDRAEIARRLTAGQIWELPENLGHNLSQSLQVTRCSSQDPGAEAYSDLVIATSALEVGYDDPEAGGIIHHKRPLSMASFIQRKGRAGRPRGMRPWTVAVLSDYGGDRWAFENAESLFIPKIDAIYLPITNPYVLRIQLTYFMVDWIGREVSSGSPFEYLSKPSDYLESSRQQAIAILDDFIKMGPCWNRFYADAIDLFKNRSFGPAVNISAEQLDALIWEHPRPLLRQAIPALRRKLRARWKYANPKNAGEAEDKGASAPLPGYLPSATFFGLSLSQVKIFFDMPEGREKQEELMDVSRALFEVCPGRVSKRFSIWSRDLSAGFWHAYSESLLSSAKTCEAAEALFPESQYIGLCYGHRVYQLKKVTLKQRPQSVKDSSYAAWLWMSAFTPKGKTAGELPIFKGKKWKKVVASVEAFIRRSHSYLEVTRFAHSFEYSLQMRRAEEPVRGALSLASADESGASVKQAVGFRQELDGIVLRLNSEHVAKLPEITSEMEESFKADYYLDRLQNHAELKKAINPFLIGWIWQVSLAMLIEAAASNSCSLAEAQNLLKDKRGEAAEKVLSHIFQISNIATNEDEPRLKEQLLRIWQNPAFVEHIASAEKVLWQKHGAGWDSWIRKRYASTLAQAFRFAVAATADKLAEDDFGVDVHFESDKDVYIYLTELDSGGLGQVELAINSLRASPERFYQGFFYALSNCARSEISSGLYAVSKKALADKKMRAAFSLARAASSFKKAEEAKGALAKALKENGFQPTRALAVSLMTKILKPGSTADSDKILCNLNEKWHGKERLLKIAIDPRVFAYLCASDTKIKKDMVSFFRKVNPRESPSGLQIYHAAQQMLLSVCKDSCPGCLKSASRFSTPVSPSRQLALAWLDYKAPVVNYDNNKDKWLKMAEESLKKYSRVDVELQSSSLSEATSALFKALESELDVDCILAPIVVSGVRQRGELWYISLMIRGAEYE